MSWTGPRRIPWMLAKTRPSFEAVTLPGVMSSSETISTWPTVGAEAGGGAPAGAAAGVDAAVVFEGDAASCLEQDASASSIAAARTRFVFMAFRSVPIRLEA